MAPFLRLEMMRQHLASYQEARRILADNFTSVAERKAAIHIRDEFVALAPSYLKELVAGVETLIAYTEGEECADPETCGHPSGNGWMCSRCRLRVAGER